MRHLIGSVGRRIITIAVVFGLLNPGASHIGANAFSYSISRSTDQDQSGLSSTNQTDTANDNNILLAELFHDSRDPLYRSPGGPVESGSTVVLRLRAASGDLTAAKVRIFNDRQNTLAILDMSAVVDDGTHQWWQITIPSSSLPTVIWYRFIVVDGSDVDYYADDNELLGGIGTPSEEEVDNNWQLTIYDPAFHTPDWVKNSIIYQIFIDRFRDGDSRNNTEIGSFYYGEEDTIYRSNTSLWNQVICDPLDMDGVCPGVYGENFYGGDFQGIISKLDYLQALGVTVISINPIFKTPSNHGYDTTNYQVLDDSLDGIDLSNLVTQADDHEISVILNGAFHFTSSDSRYFDKYIRYLSGLGACESLASYSRDWYFFYDVAPGTGPCVGSDGTENGANYLSWHSIDSLPILNSTSSEVQNQIRGTGISYTNLGAAGWLLDTGGQIDPGALTDPTNEYWEEFRIAIHAANPNAYIVGEEWGNATSWTLGSEWDASTNYQLSNAILGFWRSEPFIDNDHNADSPLGVIEPLLPSQLNERLLDQQERYAPEALQAMMNILDSYDTNRALFMLDPNTYLNDSSIYLNPNYSWNNAISRLKGAALLQMTLPGAPTIYYGDEVGLVGPVTYDTQAETWLDDPYNRMPYPWILESGTPFYTHLQDPTSQDALRNYYTILTSTRNAHPALRTGSFDPLLVDDTHLVYAFGRRLFDPVDAAVIVLNRSTQAQTVNLDLSGYLPITAFLSDVLHDNTMYQITEDGSLSPTLTIPAMSGALLIFVSGDLMPPTAPSNLIASGGENQVSLTWDTVAEAESYQVFRSLFPDSGYTQITTTTTANYVDTNVTNGTSYYYVVRSVKLLGQVSEYSNEVTALPHWNIDWANLQSPTELTHTIGTTSTQPIYGQLYIEDATNNPGQTEGIITQVGYGTEGIQPSEWSTWQEATFDSDQGDNDQFASPLLPESSGDFQVVYRYSVTNGLDWTYADLNGILSGTPINPAILHVLPSEDVTAPEIPTNFQLLDWGDDHVTMTWDPVVDDPTLYAYDIYRSLDIGSNGEKIARVFAPFIEYTDTQVIKGTLYYYRVQAVDASFNFSELSNQITANTTTRQISVTFTVDVPYFTEGNVYIVGNHPKIGSWDPDKILMEQVDTNIWSITLTFEEGVVLEYTFTRGNYAWLDRETASDGNTEIPNRTLWVEADSSGELVVNTMVENWRDPLVASSFPQTNATEVPINPTITVTWNQAMSADTTFTVTGPSGEIDGTFSYNPATWTVSFTPATYLELNTTYTIDAAFQIDSVGDHQLEQSSWTFTTIETITIHTVALPMIQKN